MNFLNFKLCPVLKMKWVFKMLDSIEFNFRRYFSRATSIIGDWAICCFRAKRPFRVWSGFPKPYLT